MRLFRQVLQSASYSSMLEGKKSVMKVVVIGLGYVGLPLALAFSKISDVVGFDINEVRVGELVRGYDSTGELSDAELASCLNIQFTNDPSLLEGGDYYIITVPTPVNSQNIPDLSSLEASSKLVGEYLSVGAIVVYESTVYPGATEEVCIPILEEISGLKLNTDFGVGYSPERINPGDRARPLTSITKVTSGSNFDTATRVNDLYNKIISAGTHLAPNIRTAEASKVIENTQRDLNIALINELSIIFDKMGLSTHEVLRAARTKWNFHDYQPGLVGGHCISVDPYYLTYKAKELGYEAKVILAGRGINDSMGVYIAQKTMHIMKQKELNSFKSVLLLGYAFKENCGDTRNTKSQDIIDEFLRFNFEVSVYDPLIELSNVPVCSNLRFLNSLCGDEKYDAVILTVPHAKIISLGENKLKSLTAKNGVFIDVKSAFPKDFSDWQL